MKYAIIYSSRTGNTKMLAEEIRRSLSNEDCVYIGAPDDAALSADRLYVGFWTDKGTCDDVLGKFLAKVQGKEIFLFGTAGFGGQPSYFERILNSVSEKLDKSNIIIDTFMCQGKMPMSVRERYEKMMESPNHAPNLKEMIENFDRALAHPNESDLRKLKEKVIKKFH